MSICTLHSFARFENRAFGKQPNDAGGTQKGLGFNNPFLK
jgi:hypothetical protein